MKKKDVKVGDSVTCKEAVDAYYSNYAGNPTVTFEPGMVGTVGSVDVPAPHRNVSFVCVDFRMPGVFSGNPKFGHDVWRCSLLYDNIVRAA